VLLLWSRALWIWGAFLMEMAMSRGIHLETFGVRSLADFLEEAWLLQYSPGHRSHRYSFQDDGAKRMRSPYSLSCSLFWVSWRGAREISQISIKKWFDIGDSNFQIYFLLSSTTSRFAGFAYQGDNFFCFQPWRSRQVWSNQTPLSFKC